MIDRPSRRTVLKYGATAALSAGLARVLEGQGQNRATQRTVVIMFDGFGVDYLAQSKMPVLEQWKRDGLYKPVKGLMPSVTNINNASICCGVWPDEHGITGNTYFDEQRGVEDYTESPDLLLAPTLFERAARKGVKSALLSSKAKTITFLLRGAEIVLTAENPTPEWVQKIGPAQSIYSREINYWVMAAAIDVLKNPKDSEKVREIISALKGVERVIARDAAAREYKLLKSRIGDLVVWGDTSTVFGEMEMEREDFPSGLRSHGSLHELDIPLFAYNAKGAPSADFFTHNLDLARWMYQG